MVFPMEVDKSSKQKLHYVIFIYSLEVAIIIGTLGIVGLYSFNLTLGFKFDLHLPDVMPLIYLIR